LIINGRYQPPPLPTPPRTIPRLLKTEYDPESKFVTGSITEVEDPGKFAVIVFIRHNESSMDYKHMPNDYEAIHIINNDCTFESQAYSNYRYSDDIEARYYSVLLIYADTDFKEAIATAHKLGVQVWDILKDFAIDMKIGET
jgi:hypothetical protein